MLFRSQETIASGKLVERPWGMFGPQISDEYLQIDPFITKEAQRMAIVIIGQQKREDKQSFIRPNIQEPTQYR